MFCPNCGLKETQDTQYCRACGGDLNSVRVALVNPGSASRDQVRTEIGRAFALKIEGFKTAKELRKATEKILPEIESFLATPEEKRLARIRQGTVISLVGVGAAIGCSLAGVFGDKDFFVLASLGIVALFVGLAFLLNGFFFSIPGQQSNSEPNENEFPDSLKSARRDTNDLLMPPSARSEFSSVTENTTRTLEDKIPVSDSRDTE